MEEESDRERGERERVSGGGTLEVELVLLLPLGEAVLLRHRLSRFAAGRRKTEAEANPSRARKGFLPPPLPTFPQ